MDQSISIAQDALSHPPPAIQDFPLMQQAQHALDPAAAPAIPPAPASHAEHKLQVVDEHQHFTTKLNEHLAQWQLLDAGFDYNLVAVFGSQSTGKSTLLNRLFHTEFDVMSETERRQTTKGIWMSRAPEETMPVLVMDVEGTDGRERGEDQDFERKSALFSIAVAEILLVNIWEHQVGLYQGANMGLLKTVFEVNLGLFLAARAKHTDHAAATTQHKTLLLFVIRDHIGATPLSNLKQTLTTDLNRLWQSLAKPDGLEQSEISHFFDLDFVTLPHKLLQPDKFEQDVVNLRARFVKSNADSLFKPEYHKHIPADGLDQYMSSIWEAVVSNKDLDLPTQQELLAQFRCDEIASTAFVLFTEHLVKFPTSTGTGKIVPGLGAMMRQVIQLTLASYDTAASRYSRSVYARKRSELQTKLHSNLFPLYQTQLKHLHKSILRTYRVSIETALKQEGYDFARVVDEAKRVALEQFDSEAQELELEESGWKRDEQGTLLREDLESVAELLRKEETRKMIAIIERNIKKQIADVVEISLNAPKPDMWDRVLSEFKACLDKAEQAYLSKATSFNCTEEENQQSLSLLRRRAWLALRAKIDEHTSESVLLNKLKGVFEDKFRYDHDGVPRVWKPEDDIDGIFKKARESTLELIPLYASIKPLDPKNEFELGPESSSSITDSTPTSSTDVEPFDFVTSLSILSSSQQVTISTRFKREADAYYLEAKRSMVVSKAQIPVWIYGVLVVLGWNEFVAVIRSPIYFTFLLLAGAAAYVTWSLNMTGPVLAVTKGVTNEVIRTVNDQLHNYFNNQTVQAHVERDRRRESPISSIPVPSSNKTQSVDEVELKDKAKAE
ncbi:dynamin-like GTPase SEY1 [Sporobolomyces koalae]|uniref:dynamin-like GTPase SEY1 n=1 Tax=Sporobolomyces koalae TaxID=500713 RepID=UPI003181881C